MAATAVRAAAFTSQRYHIRRKFLALVNQFYVENEQGQLVGYCRQKPFKLKEDVRLFTDENRTTELLSMQARSILDFNVAYDVVDSVTGEKVGALKRKGWKSLFKDEWIIMNAMDQEIGFVKEDSALLATLRRYVINLIPQKYVFEIGTHEVGTAKQNFNFFAPKLNVDFSSDPANLLDRRLGLAAALLLMSIEGRQSENA